MTKKGDLIHVEGMEPRVRLEDGALGCMCAISDAATLSEYGLDPEETKAKHERGITA